MATQVAFRCPDELNELIEARMQVTGQDKSKTMISMLTGLPSVSINDRKQLPNTEAIYLVWTFDKLLYIGQTLDVKARLAGHHRLVQFLEAEANVSWFESANYDREDIEAQLIELLEPELNGEVLPEDLKRRSKDSRKVDIVLPNAVYDSIVQLAKDSGVPVHHRSGEPTLSPTILHLILLGIQSIKDDPDKLTASLSAIPTDSGMSEVISTVGKLADRIQALEARLTDKASNDIADGSPDLLTRAAIEKKIAAAIAPIQQQLELLGNTPTPAPAQSKAKAPKPPKTEGSGEGIFIGDFRKQHQLSHEDLPNGVNIDQAAAVLAKAGLSDRYEYRTLPKRGFYPL